MKVPKPCCMSMRLGLLIATGIDLILYTITFIAHLGVFALMLLKEADNKPFENTSTTVRSTSISTNATTVASTKAPAVNAKDKNNMTFTNLLGVGKEVDGVNVFLWIALFLVFIIGLISAIVVLVGAMKRDNNTCKIGLVIGIISTFLAIIFGVALAFESSFASIVYSCVPACYRIYMFWVIVAFIQDNDPNRANIPPGKEIEEGDGDAPGAEGDGSKPLADGSATASSTATPGGSGSVATIASTTTVSDETNPDHPEKKSKAKHALEAHH